VSARTSGTGLGLAIALDIARSHGGDITLGDSRAGGCGNGAGAGVACSVGPLVAREAGFLLARS
jgi:signal transduction histidine kinase